jgi:SAM-dependent methyltransferase
LHHVAFEGQGVSLALRRIRDAPAAQALLIQCGALPIAAAAILLLVRAGMPVSLGAGVLLQGALAASLTRWHGLAPWWLAIQFLFPLALLGGLLLRLPPSLCLAGFLVLLAVYWSSFRTQVPYFPSGARVWEAVAQLLPPGRPVSVIDIGSGLGGLVLELARRRPESLIAGIELAPLPWLVSRLRAQLSGSGARFVRGDYEQLDFRHYDVVFAYLSPAAMSALYRKAQAEMRPGSMLISYEFTILDKSPDLVIVPTGRDANVYVWHF